MYKNSRRPFYMRGQLSVFEKTMIADNSDGPLWAYETIFRDSVTIGWSRNAEVDFFFDAHVRQETKGNTMRPKGIMVYDGPFVSSDMVFAGFPASRVGRTEQWIPGYEWSQVGVDAVGQHLSIAVGDPLTQEQFKMLQSNYVLPIRRLSDELKFIEPSAGVKPVDWLSFRVPSENDVTPAGIGINPAEFRFFAQVQRAEFLNPANPAMKADFRLGLFPGGGTQAVSVRDTTGSYAGLKGAALVPDNSINYIPSCERLPDTVLALRCPDFEMSALMLLPTVQDKRTVLIARIPISELTPTKRPSATDPMFKVIRNFGMAQNKDQSYHVLNCVLSERMWHDIAFEFQQKPSDELMRVAGVKYVANDVGKVSPPIYFWGNGGCSSSRLIFPGYKTLAKEEDLLRGDYALAVGGVFYGEEYTAVRFRATLARFAPPWDRVNFPEYYSKPGVHQSVYLQNRSVDITWPKVDPPRNYAIPTELEPNTLTGKAYSMNQICCGDCNDDYAAFKSPFGPNDIVEFGHDIETFTNTATDGKMSIKGIACAKGDPRPVTVMLVFRGLGKVLWEGLADKSTNGRSSIVCGLTETAGTSDLHQFEIEIEMSTLQAQGVPIGALMDDFDLIAQTNEGVFGPILIPDYVRFKHQKRVWISSDVDLHEKASILGVHPPEMTPCQLLRYQRRQVALAAGSKSVPGWRRCTWADMIPEERIAENAAIVSTILKNGSSFGIEAEAMVIAQTRVDKPCSDIDMVATERQLCADSAEHYTTSNNTVCLVTCQDVDDQGRDRRNDGTTILSLVVVGLRGAIQPVEADSISNVTLSFLDGVVVQSVLRLTAGGVVTVPFDLASVSSQGATVSFRDHVAAAVFPSTAGTETPTASTEASASSITSTVAQHVPLSTMQIPNNAAGRSSVLNRWGTAFSTIALMIYIGF